MYMAQQHRGEISTIVLISGHLSASPHHRRKPQGVRMSAGVCAVQAKCDAPSQRRDHVSVCPSQPSAALNERRTTRVKWLLGNRVNGDQSMGRAGGWRKGPSARWDAPLEG